MTPNPESALNEAAGKLLLEDYDAFIDKAKEMTLIHARHLSSPSLAATKRPADAKEDLKAGGNTNPTLADVKKRLRKI